MTQHCDSALDVSALRYARLAASDASAGFSLEIPALRLERGDAIGLVGASGCGKSTVIDLLALLRQPVSVHRFLLAGHDVAALWRAGDVAGCAALRARYVGVVLQTGGLLPALPAMENVLLSQRLLGCMDMTWAARLFARLDLTGLERRLPQQLSIGQRQRVAIARALAHRPSLVLADEPTAALGPEHGPAAVALMQELAAETGAAVLVVSHDRTLLAGQGLKIVTCALRGGVSMVSA